MGSRDRRAARLGVATALVAAAALAVSIPATATESGRTPASKDQPTQLVGAASGVLRWPGWENHRVSFEVDAKGNPGESVGTLRINHVLPDGSPFADLTATVDCLAVHDDLAIVTATVDPGGQLPGLPGLDLTGRRIGVSVVDDGRRGDQLGWSWAIGGFQYDTLPCSGTVPFLPTDRGDYRVSGEIPL